MAKKQWGWLKRNLAKWIIMDRQVSQTHEIKEEQGNITLTYTPGEEGTDGAYMNMGAVAGILDGHFIRDTAIGACLDTPDTDAIYDLAVETDSGVRFEYETTREDFSRWKNHERVMVRYEEDVRLISGRSDPNEPITPQRRFILSRNLIGVEKLVS